MLDTKTLNHSLVSYDEFRTGLTFQQVYSLIWSYSEDSKQWPKGKATPSQRKDGKGKTSGRRHTVLGKWRQIKQEMYNYYLEGVSNDFDLS